jgi:hypothetical protein
LDVKLVMPAVEAAWRDIEGANVWLHKNLVAAHWETDQFSFKSAIFEKRKLKLGGPGNSSRVVAGKGGSCKPIRHPN